MAEHKQYAQNDLRAEVLSEIAQRHQLIRCPVCELPLGPAVCGAGEVLYLPDLHSIGSPQSLFCRSCTVFWNLDMGVWSETRRDLHGHSLWIWATANCICRRDVVRRLEFHRVENPVDGYPGRLNLPADCPSWTLTSRAP